MRMLTSYLSVALLAMLATAQEDESERTGVARIMPFHKPANENSFSKRHGQGTWYNGKDLTNAACYNRNGLPRWDATAHDMIGAMAMNDHEQCYKCVQITNSKDRKLSTTVMIVDKCAACKVGQAIDLTPGAFSLISPKGDLAVGVLDITWKPVPCWRVHHHPQVPQRGHSPAPEHGHPPVPQRAQPHIPQRGHRKVSQHEHHQLVQHHHHYGPRSMEDDEQ
ncbi:hypothetical protein BX666DRAFT_1898864 [Dichotomocladium elegans]|nr:hypothetical protein BX666DRAFT_1898864 [Dichotomocladium elegans]